MSELSIIPNRLKYFEVNDITKILKEVKSAITEAKNYNQTLTPVENVSSEKNKTNTKKTNEKEKNQNAVINSQKNKSENGIINSQKNKDKNNVQNNTTVPDSTNISNNVEIAVNSTTKNTESLKELSKCAIKDVVNISIKAIELLKKEDENTKAYEPTISDNNIIKDKTEVKAKEKNQNAVINSQKNKSENGIINSQKNKDKNNVQNNTTIIDSTNININSPQNTTQKGLKYIKEHSKCVIKDVSQIIKILKADNKSVFSVNTSGIQNISLKFKNAMTAYRCNQ